MQKMGQVQLIRIEHAYNNTNSCNMLSVFASGTAVRIENKII